MKGQESDSGVGEGLKSTAAKWLRAADKQPLQNCSKIQRSNLACNLVAMFHVGLHLWDQLLTGQTSLLYCTCTVGLLVNFVKLLIMLKTIAMNLVGFKQVWIKSLMIIHIPNLVTRMPQTA